MKQLIFLFQQLSKGDTHVFQDQSGNYFPDNHPKENGFERFSIESRIAFEMFGEYPLSESRKPEWDLIKSSINLS